jgi:hypothetical protein
MEKDTEKQKSPEKDVERGSSPSEISNLMAKFRMILLLIFVLKAIGCVSVSQFREPEVKDSKPKDRAGAEEKPGKKEALKEKKGGQEDKAKNAKEAMQRKLKDIIQNRAFLLQLGRLVVLKKKIKSEKNDTRRRVLEKVYETKLRIFASSSHISLEQAENFVEIAEVNNDTLDATEDIIEALDAISFDELLEGQNIEDLLGDTEDSPTIVDDPNLGVERK